MWGVVSCVGFPRLRPLSMIRPLLLLSVLLLLFGLVPAPARAQNLPGCKTSKQFKIDQIEKDHWKLTGTVEIDCDTYKIYADEVDVYTALHRVTAQGNVVFTDGTARIAGERADFDTEAKTGTFYVASGSATLGDRAKKDMFAGQEPDMYFYGEEVSKIGPDRYKITHGSFTTCLQPTPRWQLVATSMVVHVDHYASLKNTVLKAKVVPVLYLPIVYYPIKKENRATGFLMPSYGLSTIKGFTFSEAFFWAIDRSQDATFLVDWFSRTGFGYGGEYRYVASPGSSGDFRAYGLNEHATTYTTTVGGESVLVDQPARESYQITGSANQALPWRMRLRGNVSYFSDVTVQQTYNQDIYNASLRQRGYGVNLSGNWKGYGMSATVQRNGTYLTTTDSYVTGDQPRISISRAAQRIGKLPIVFGIGGEVVKLVRGNTSPTVSFVDQGLTRVDVMPQVRVPFTRWQFLPMDASLAFRDTWYSQSLQGGARSTEPVNRHYFRVTASVTGPILERIWNTPASGFAEKIKNVIEPSVAFERYSTIPNSAQIIKYEGLDYIVGGTSSTTYGVTTRLLAKKREGPSGSTTLEFLTASVNQTYYTDATASQYDSTYSTSFTIRPPSNWSPIALNVRAAPSGTFNGQLKLEYDPILGMLQTVSAIGGYAPGTWLHINAGWSKHNLPSGTVIVRDNYLNASASMRTSTNRFGGNGGFNFDLGNKSLLQYRLVGYYNAQCCGFAVEYQAYNFPTGDPRFPVNRDRRFNFSVTLAGLGTFSNNFGALAGAGQ